MGLCSTPTPHQLLLNLSAHLDHSNPDSRILLLEHGRSSYDWLNNILDNSAAKHAEIHGCWYNRDVGEMVQGAAEQSGLEVVEVWRKHFGTTWVFELRPKAVEGKGEGKKVDGAVSSSEVVVEAACSFATRVHSIYIVVFYPLQLQLQRYSHLVLHYSPPSSFRLPMQPVPRLPPATIPLPRFLPL